jgi:serine/threonine protein kinase
MLKHGAYVGETLAYRHLRSLQGSVIPRLHGTVRLPISDGSPFLHPIVDFVHGLAIEYIVSPTMADVAVGVDVTSQRAEEISRRILDGVAAIRDAHCHHNDLRLANVVFRNWPHDPLPVVIDFGTSSILVPGSPREASFGTVDEVEDMRKLLSNGDYGNWHVRSPLQQHVYERHAQVVGYATINSEIEQIPDDVRSIQFERIPGSGGTEEKDKMLQWRVRPGIRTRDDYEHEWLLAYPPDPDEYIPPPM